MCIYDPLSLLNLSFAEINISGIGNRRSSTQGLRESTICTAVLVALIGEVYTSVAQSSGRVHKALLKTKMWSWACCRGWAQGFECLKLKMREHIGYVVIVPGNINSQIIKLPVNQLIWGVNEHPVMSLYLGFLCCLFPGRCSVLPLGHSSWSGWLCLWPRWGWRGQHPHSGVTWAWNYLGPWWWALQQGNTQNCTTFTTHLWQSLATDSMFIKPSPSSPVLQPTVKLDDWHVNQL